MAIESLVKDAEVTTTKFSPEYKIVEDYFSPSALNTRTCTMGRISKKLGYSP